MELDELISTVKQELSDREYSQIVQATFMREWKRLSDWMHRNNISTFDKDAGYRYCDEVLGDHIITDDFSESMRTRLRAIRILVSYLETGEFEFRSPRRGREIIYEGELGNIVLSFIEEKKKSGLSFRTIDNKRRNLYDFYCHLKNHNLSLSDITAETIDNYFLSEQYSAEKRYRIASVVRDFLHYIFTEEIVEFDASVFVESGKYNKQNKLPTTYSEDEVRKTLECVDCSSPIGKRDYIILLLAAEYGWRAHDITHFTFSQIDWDANIIHLSTQKTGNSMDYPLLPSVGNAIISYLQHGRPKSDSDYILLSMHRSNYGKQLSEPTLHSVVSKYLRKAKIPNWSTRRHGPHALRFSLASSLQKMDCPIEVIKNVLTHDDIQTTNGYIKIDIEKLRRCPLPMPELHSALYV